MEKKTLIRTAVAAALLLMAGCTKETGSGAGEGLPMRVAPSLAADSKASLQTADLQAFYLQLDCTDKLFSFFGKVSRSGSEWKASQPLLWKDKTTPVNYCAACFGDHVFTADEFSGGVDLAVPADQSTQAELNSADLLTLKASDSKYEDTVDGTLPVQLGHGLAKVNFVLSLGSAFYDARIGRNDNPVTAFTVKGANTGFNFKPQTGAVTVTDATQADITPLAGTYTPFSATTTAATVTYEAILVPQTFAAGALSVSISIGDAKYTWSNAEAITLVAGKTVNQPVSITAPYKPTINGHEYVDLGLSVKWATCNVGAAKPEDYGDYFAWGETVKKDKYSLDTYKWYKGSGITKYMDSNHATLQPEDDAATANWGSPWRMPTIEEINELLATRPNPKYNWSFGPEGLSLMSPLTGEKILFPYAGFCDEGTVLVAGFYGYYWTSSLTTDSSSNAYSLDFNSTSVKQESRFRYFGYSVRPVTE